MFVYVVAALDGSQPWKIGRTTNPPARLKNLQAHSPVQLAYVKIVEAHQTLEGSLHRQFDQYRIHGEWFNLPEDQTALVLARLDGEPWVVQIVPASKGKYRKARTQPHQRKMQKAQAARKYVTPRDRRGNTRRIPGDGFRLD